LSVKDTDRRLFLIRHCAECTENRFE